MRLKKRKLIAFIIGISVITGLAGCSSKVNTSSENKALTQVEDETQPTLSLNYEGDLVAGDEKEILVEAKLSSLPAGVYPSASMSVEFDNKKLEFLGIEPGTMESYSKNVPSWSVDVEASNKLGVVNTIYLDSLGGKEAYYKSGFEKDKKDIVLSLRFKLKSELKASDSIYFGIVDAVFATVNGDSDDKNLSTLKNTMRNKNLKIDVK